MRYFTSESLPLRKVVSLLAGTRRLQTVTVARRVRSGEDPKECSTLAHLELKCLKNELCKILSTIELTEIEKEVLKY